MPKSVLTYLVNIIDTRISNITTQHNKIII